MLRCVCVSECVCVCACNFPFSARQIVERVACLWRFIDVICEIGFLPTLGIIFPGSCGFIAVLAVVCTHTFTYKYIHRIHTYIYRQKLNKLIRRKFATLHNLASTQAIPACDRTIQQFAKKAFLSQVLGINLTFECYAGLNARTEQIMKLQSQLFRRNNDL